MPKRGRRSGARFIEDDRDRSLTFFKRRFGVFKAASDLSTLTGVRIAVVFESENERFSAFGTPDATPIVDAFLSGDVPTDFDTSEEQKAKRINLQNELCQLEKDKAMGEKMKKESTGQINKNLETSRTAKYAYGKEEDLDVTELYDMLRNLTKVKQEIRDIWPTLLHDNHVEASGQLRDPSLLQPTWWRSMPSKAATPPKYSPQTPSEASLQEHPWSSSSHPMLARSSSFIPKSVILPSQEVQQKLHQHPLTPCAPSVMQLQGSMPKEAYPYNYHIHGLDISGNNSRPSLSPVPPLPLPQPSLLQTPPSNGSSPLLSSQFSSPLHLDSQQLSFNPQNYSPVLPPQNYVHTGVYNNSLGLNVELGNNVVNEGQTSGGHSKGFGLSTPVEGDGWAGMTPESSSTGVDARYNNALNSPWYYN